MKTSVSLVVVALAVVRAGFATPPHSRVIDRGEHYKVIEIQKQTTNQAGKVSVQSARYTVLQPGLHWKDASSNWVESRPFLESQTEAVICTGAAYQVTLSRNLNRTAAVDVTLATNDQDAAAHFKSHVVGVYYHDPETGKRLPLGIVKDSVAEVFSTAGQIVYRDAIDGIHADVIYHYGIGRFEQDVILRESPPPPSIFGLGSRTRLEVISEVVDSPAPVKTVQVLKQEVDPVRRAQMVEPDSLNEKLRFGKMVMPIGRAFQTTEKGSGPGSRPVPVAKRFMDIDVKHFLIETVEWGDVREQLESLPKQAAHSTGVTKQARFRLGLPAVREAKEPDTTPGPIRTARAAGGKHGFVIDWVLVQSIPDFTFASYQTYLVPNIGAYIENVTFQPETVIKFARCAGLELCGSVIPVAPSATKSTA